MNSFENIKDATQLQEYLSKHAAASGAQGNTAQNPVKRMDVSPVANDYMGIKQKKQNARDHLESDRYEISAKKNLQDLADAKVDRACVNEDEKRSIHTELDYSKKDATRHIVQGKSNPAKLRLKLLRNLEGVRKNIAIEASQATTSLYSMRSRMTNATARASQANA